MVRAQQADDDAEDQERHAGKRDGIPPLQHHPLEPDVGALAALEHTPRITSLADGGLDEWREVATALELVLDAKPTVDAKVLGPLGVELALEVKGAFLVGDVAWSDEEGEADPKEESVDGEERTVVEENATPADERGNEGQGDGDSGQDELWTVANANDIRMVKGVEPSAEQEYEAGESVNGELSKDTNAKY